MELSDLKIIYQKGAPIAYIPPLTIQGRQWLWDHVKYPYSGSNAIVGQANDLLAGVIDAVGDIKKVTDLIEENLLALLHADVLAFTMMSR